MNRTASDPRAPDSRLAKEAEDLVREACPPFLANHCLRSYAWAVALAGRERIRFDAELLYVAALLHDLGLVARFDAGRCFEEDGARAAADLARGHGWPDQRRQALAEAIRLHVAVEIAMDHGAEAYLLWHATGLDVTGHRHDDIEPRTIARVMSDYPRLDFASGFTELLADQAERKPRCWAATAIESGIAAHIAASPLERAQG
jgi:hypothetical protein